MTDYTYLVQLVGVGVGGGSRGDRLHLPCPTDRGRGGGGSRGDRLHYIPCPTGRGRDGGWEPG